MESFNKKFMAKVDALKQRINKKKREDRDEFEDQIDDNENGF